MKKERNTILIALFALFVLSCPAKSIAQNIPPIADAGLSRYAATDPVQLDGTVSFDPDNSGLLSYAWRQIAGQSIIITDANTANPTISGFVQTSEIQECEFELLVSDGELTSLPDAVKVIIVPTFSASTTFQQKNPPFDPNKPTVIFFGGGNCVTGKSSWNSTKWAGWDEKANIIFFPNYGPDPGGGSRTYYRCGDMIIVYLSSVAPDYKQPIQTIGFSTGGDPAIDVGIHLNRVYRDARYAVNRMTELDTGCRIFQQGWDFYFDIVDLLLTSSVDGEQCWIDFYDGGERPPHLTFALRDILSVSLGLSHGGVRNWYRNSLTGNDMNKFNSGVVAGAYWSVIGPGKNLQLAPQTDAYYFRWDGSEQIGSMSIYDEALHTGMLPEPVTLVGPVDVGDPNGAVLTCEESENAVGYQLLFGADPYRVMDYNIISDTPAPPNEVIITLPFDETWWTVRVRDQYGSTIYADPMRINTFALSFPVDNLTTGKRYVYIQDAIDEAYLGDEIVASEGIYRENIDFKGKILTLRSTDPNDSAVVAATIINAGNQGSVVTFSSSEDASCVFAGFTITNSNNGIYCSGASPTIINCNITANAGAGIELYNGSNPTIANCCIAANAGSGIEMLVYKSGRIIVYNYPTITNCTIAGNLQSGISGGIPTITNSIIWANSPQQIADTQGSVTYSNIQAGWAGEGNIDADPLFADPNNGDYHLKSQAGRWNPISGSWVIDEATSPCIDAGDPVTPVGLEPLPNGGIINMGAYGGNAEASKSPEN